MTGSNDYESKVERVSHKYGLDGIDKELESRWTRTNDRYSLRDLAEFFNIQILESAMEAADMASLEGDAANVYRLLTDEDVNRGNRTQTKRHLEQNGIDADELITDFVSYQAINRHLKNVLGVKYPEETEKVEPEEAAQRIFALQNRTKVVAENTLDQIQGREDFSTGDLDVLVDISITCYRCGQQLDVRQFIERNGCECGRHRDE